MNGADAFNLSTSALTKVLKMLDAYDADPDADLEDTAEDIRGICEDTLTHLRDGGFIRDQVAAMREP